MTNFAGQNYVSTLNAPEFEEEIKHLIDYVKSTIDPEWDEYEGEEEIAYNDLTIGMNPAGEWSFQTGDNSFTGGAYGYPHWAVVSITEDSDPAEVFQDICDQLADLMEQ